VKVEKTGYDIILKERWTLGEGGGEGRMGERCGCDDRLEGKRRGEGSSVKAVGIDLMHSHFSPPLCLALIQVCIPEFSIEGQNNTKDLQ